MVVFEAVILGVVHHVLDACESVAAEVGDYAGYDVAVGVTGMRGAVSHELDQHATAHPTP